MIRLNCNPALRTTLACLCAVALLGGANPSAAQTTRPSEGDVVLAENYAQLAQMAVSTRAITPETLRQSIALLKAARRLNPDELRFARLLAEAALQAGDIDTALDAFKAINRLDPHNRVAQIRLIDLYAGRMQSADERLRYLVGDGEHPGVYGASSVPAEVRSHAAFLASQIYFERAERSEAMRMLEEALALFPLSPEALNLKYQLTGSAGTPRERVALLLQMLRSNPGQPGVMARLGHELASVGMHESALDWYQRALGLAQRVGRGVAADDFDEFAALLVIAGNPATAQQIATGMLQADMRNVDAAMLTVLIQRRGGDEDSLKAALTTAERALVTRAMNVGQVLRGETPTTQPGEQEVQVDVPGDVKRLQEQGDANLIASYASTLADLAWLRVYFQNNPQEAAQVIGQLRQLLPPDSVTLARLEGWTYLAAGQTQEAQSKLSAVADRDPLAALGMIRLIEKDNPERATADARKLMDENPSGLLGAIIHDALRDKKPKLPAGESPPLSETAQEVKRELDAFPMEWLDFNDKPAGFYFLRAEPMKVEHRYGEPMIARVILTNTGDYPITVGPDSAIRPDLWFDVVIRGAMQDFVQGVAFDRLTQHVVLQPDQRIDQTVRVDQDRLYQILQANASATLPLFYSVFTNPITIQTGIAPGPGGQRESFFRPINRVGMQVDHKTIQKTWTDALTRLSTGSTGEKIRALDALAWFAQLAARQQEEEDRTKAAETLASMFKATNDRSPAVRAWAGYMMIRTGVLGEEQRQRVIEQMLADPSWEARLLGALMVQSLEATRWKELVGPLAENDPEPVVREFAQAVIEFADNPAATQPAAPPAEGEGAGTDSPVAQP